MFKVQKLRYHFKIIFFRRTEVTLSTGFV